MYKDDFTEDVEIEETMTLCVNGLLELSVLHWYSMYLYAYGGFKGRDKTAYFNPRMIHFDVCDKYENFVIDHIKDVMDHHKERHYFMAPHLAWGHWSLSVIFHNPSNLKFYGYIIDSKKKERVLRVTSLLNYLKRLRERTLYGKWLIALNKRVAGNVDIMS
uniref:Ulp1 protease family, C-terminal catalytic domain-containing protein n=1 Tax=Helianthus annuus TaxID=4232 RepID=A0A251T000_HELAN